MELRVKVYLNTFVNIKKNGAFAPKEQMLHFPKIFKYVIFQRRQKVLIWSKGLKSIALTFNAVRGNI